ncbi:MAG: FkbM family methyltransferase, partial [Nanoarchaeota archaeon]|nr:FkbM family methyltransferase [Nanoarchaeota archaeon]
GEEKKIIPVLLDEVLLGKRVDLIKIDTQGAELRVIKGAIRLIKQNPNLNIMMEFCPIGIKKVGDNPLEILTLLKSLGFTARLIETGKMISFEKLSKIKEQESLNLLLSRVLVENQG